MYLDLDNLGHAVAGMKRREFTPVQPGCYGFTYGRVKAACRKVGARAFPSWDLKVTFCRLWANAITAKSPTNWLDLPDQYRGKGAAGALAFAGRGVILETDAIWAGGLKPGAVVQAWTYARAYDEVKQGIQSVVYGGTADYVGHSFIFIDYVRSGGGIVDMLISDQNRYRPHPLPRQYRSQMFGANYVRFHDAGAADHAFA